MAVFHLEMDDVFLPGTELLPCSSTVRNGVMRPTTEEFEEYLPAFLASNPEPICAKGGHAAYAQVPATERTPGIRVT
jgi:hypothetical protein